MWHIQWRSQAKPAAAIHLEWIEVKTWANVPNDTGKSSTDKKNINTSLDGEERGLLWR